MGIRLRGAAAISSSTWQRQARALETMLSEGRTAIGIHLACVDVIELDPRLQRLSGFRSQDASKTKVPLQIQDPSHKAIGALHLASQHVRASTRPASMRATSVQMAKTGCTTHIAEREIRDRWEKTLLQRESVSLLESRMVLELWNAQPQGEGRC